MANRLEVESAIKQLPESEIRTLANWLQDYLNEMWDKQIEADLATGKLAHLIAKAEADIATNNVRDLDEVLRNEGNHYYWIGIGDHNSYESLLK